MKKLLLAVFALCAVLGLAACGEKTQPTTTPANTDAEYKLGMGVVGVTHEKSSIQINSTVAAVVTDKDGKIVLCRIDALQVKGEYKDGALTVKNDKSKMELGNDYNMATWGATQDHNGDGIVKEWFEQAKAFENHVIGMTGTEVAAMEVAPVEGYDGYTMSTDEDLLAAGCTIQIDDFKAAVAAACADDQGMTFTTSATFTLGVAINASNESTLPTAEAAGSINFYSEYASSVVADGKVLASLNDAIQPKLALNADGTFGDFTFKGTKRVLKEGYNMAAWGADHGGPEGVLEWYKQSAAISNHVVGMTKAEVEAIPTVAAEGFDGYTITTDADLLAAGCTMTIDSIKVIIAESITNAR